MGLFYQQISDEATPVTITLDECWPEAAAALAEQRGADLGAELAAWHEDGASEAEATGNAYGLLWHLDRLAEQRPDDWRLQARRGTALAESEDFAAAEGAFARADRNGAGEALADLDSHAAAIRLRSMPDKPLGSPSNSSTSGPTPPPASP